MTHLGNLWSASVAVVSSSDWASSRYVAVDVNFAASELDAVVFSGDDGGLMTIVTLNGDCSSDRTVAGTDVIPSVFTLFDEKYFAGSWRIICR